ncbi:unnamed protein product [Sphagnum jensenii]|uniref:SLBB domain-containing protein n=1 Tax=Sphagnum jensenii TaxID=128206 RepID=A0ABP0VYJ6_9BRYO
MVEEEVSILLKELIERHCGGVRGGRDNLLAIIPGGSLVPLLPQRGLQSKPFDVCSCLGMVAVKVMDKSRDVVDAIA